MNEARRQALRSITDRLDQLVKELNEVCDAEKAAYVNRPTAFQYSPTGFLSDEAMQEMSEVADAVSNAAAGLRNFIDDSWPKRLENS